MGWLRGSVRLTRPRMRYANCLIILDWANGGQANLHKKITSAISLALSTLPPMHQHQPYIPRDSTELQRYALDRFFTICAIQTSLAVVFMEVMRSMNKQLNVLFLFAIYSPFQSLHTCSQFRKMMELASKYNWCLFKTILKQFKN